MATNFPGSLDSFANRTNGETIDASHVDDLQDAVEALEAKAGVTGSAVTTSLDYRVARLESGWGPEDQNMIAWTVDPAALLNEFTVASGTLYLARLALPATTVTNIIVDLRASGAAASNVRAGLYNSAGTLLSGSANVEASIGAAGVYTIPLGTPQAVSAGHYYAGFFIVGATPTVLTSHVSSGPNNLMGSSYRSATSTTGLGAGSAMPDPFGAMTATTRLLWVGVS